MRILLLLCLAAPIFLFGQTGPSDSLELEYFMDGLIEAHLKDKNIAGATVSVVRDGELFFAKGYGYADMKEKTPVQADKTLFRIGSISKLFVWTAIMQLYEQGKIDLETDVNEYLTDFQIPATYDEPITLTHIMTHTPGFEDYVIGLFAKDESSMRPLKEIFEEEMPARVRTPGVFASYSNHATGMAAYIVEEFSRKKWNEFTEEVFFNPLQMDHSTFRQPVPDRLLPNLAKGYTYKDGELREKEFEYVPLAPVGAASSTAIDMATFMMAHLQLGTYAGVELLDSATAQMMQREVFRHAENVNPMPYGFMDLSQNGVKIIGHGGDTFWFHSLMAMLPDHNVGLFVSFNSDGGGGTYLDVLESFMDRYYPEDLDEPNFSMTAEELKRFEGNYRSNRYAHKRFTKVAALMNPVVVTSTEEGKLRVTFNGESTYCVPIGKLTFRDEDSSNTIVFGEDENGEISHMFLGLLAIIAFEKIPMVDAAELHLLIFVLAMILYIITVLIWPILYFARKGLDTNSNRIPFHAKLVAWIAAFVYAFYFIAMSLVMRDPNEVVFGISGSLKFQFILILIGSLIALVALYFGVKVLISSKYQWVGKVHYALLCLAFLATIWQLNHWNLIGFNY